MEISSGKIPDIIDSYLYEVTRRLSEKQRKDIEDELRGLIEDMLNERAPQNAATIGDLESVLNELGSPAELADKYRDKKRYLIGPEYFDKYVEVLKIVMYAVFIGMSIVSIIVFIGMENITLVDIFSNIFSNIISALFQALVFVTLGFAIAERYAVTPLKNEKKEWSIKDLAQAPRNNEIIKKSDPITGIVFTIVFLVLFNFAPQYMGAILVTGDNFTVYSFFNTDTLKSLLPLLNIALALGLAGEIYKLIKRRYTLDLAIVTVVLNMVSMFIVVHIFTRPDILNADISKSLAEFAPVVINGKNIMQPEIAAMIIIAIFAIVYIIDTSVILYRGLQAHKYQKNHR